MRLGWMWGEDRREVLPEFLPDDRSESRAAGEGDRRLQLAELGPVGARSSRRSIDRLRERPRHDPLGPEGGDLDLREGNGDRARGAARWRSYGDRDLRSLRLGDIGRVLLSSSLLGEYLRGGLLGRGDLGLGRQFVESLGPGLLDLRLSLG